MPEVLASIAPASSSPLTLHVPSLLLPDGPAASGVEPGATSMDPGQALATQGTAGQARWNAMAQGLLLRPLSPSSHWEPAARTSTTSAWWTGTICP